MDNRFYYLSVFRSVSKIKFVFLFAVFLFLFFITFPSSNQANAQLGSCCYNVCDAGSSCNTPTCYQCVDCFNQIDCSPLGSVWEYGQCCTGGGGSCQSACCGPADSCSGRCPSGQWCNPNNGDGLCSGGMKCENLPPPPTSVRCCGPIAGQNCNPATEICTTTATSTSACPLDGTACIPKPTVCCGPIAGQNCNLTTEICTTTATSTSACPLDGTACIPKPVTPPPSGCNVGGCCGALEPCAPTNSNPDPCTAFGQVCKTLSDADTSCSSRSQCVANITDPLANCVCPVSDAPGSSTCHAGVQSGGGCVPNDTLCQSGGNLIQMPCPPGNNTSSGGFCQTWPTTGYVCNMDTGGGIIAPGLYPCNLANNSACQNLMCRKPLGYGSSWGQCVPPNRPVPCDNRQFRLEIFENGKTVSNGNAAVGEEISVYVTKEFEYNTEGGDMFVLGGTSVWPRRQVWSTDLTLSYQNKDLVDGPYSIVRFNRDPQTGEYINEVPRIIFGLPSDLKDNNFSVKGINFAAGPDEEDAYMWFTAKAFKPGTFTVNFTWKNTGYKPDNIHSEDSITTETCSSASLPITINSGPEGAARQLPCLAGVCETAIGNFDMRTPSNFIRSVYTFILEMAGAVAILLIVYSGYLLMTSQGDKQKVQQGREVLIAAISGLLFIILSTAILRIIGVQILNLPGFGG